MNSEVPAEPAATALRAAVDSVRTALGHLIKVVDDGALTDLGAQGLVGFLAEVEQVRNTLPVVDRAAIQYGIEQGVAGVLAERSMARVLMSGSAAVRWGGVPAGEVRRAHRGTPVDDRGTVGGVPAASRGRAG